jgi:uncharacterized protein with HEPN domain
MKDEVRKHLIDILQAAKEIQNFISGLDFTTYQKSLVTQRAIERDFEIIGEALNRIRKIDEEVIEGISEYQRIIGFRNILIHGYDIVDERIVWNAITNHLPILVKDIERLLES